MYGSFADELVKIAKYSQEQKDRIRRTAATMAVTSLGAGLGYGAGAATGRLLGFKHPGLGRTKLLMGTLGGLGALGGAMMKDKKREYIDKPVRNT